MGSFIRYRGTLVAEPLRDPDEGCQNNNLLAVDPALYLFGVVLYQRNAAHRRPALGGKVSALHIQILNQRHIVHIWNRFWLPERFLCSFYFLNV